MKEISIDTLRSYFYISSFLFNNEFDYVDSVSKDSLTLLLDDYNSKCEIKLCNISGLKINNLCSNIAIRIHVFDIREQQLEKLNYFVQDVEEGMFSLYCEDITIDDEILK